AGGVPEFLRRRGDEPGDLAGYCGDGWLPPDPHAAWGARGGPPWPAVRALGAPGSGTVHGPPGAQVPPADHRLARPTPLVHSPRRPGVPKTSRSDFSGM